jgi:hypothetical protein
VGEFSAARWQTVAAVSAETIFKSFAQNGITPQGQRLKAALADLAVVQHDAKGLRRCGVVSRSRIRQRTCRPEQARRPRPSTCLLGIVRT